MPKDAIRGWSSSILAFLLASAGNLGAQVLDRSAATFAGSVIESSRPVFDVADVLQARYVKPVTYEDPVWQWGGDFEKRQGILVPVRRSTPFPANLDPARTPVLDQGAVGMALLEYHKINGDGPHFQVLASAYGLHIVPESVRDASGRFVPADNPLDKIIDIPSVSRAPGQHLEAICKAASLAAGVKINCMGVMGFDRLYAKPEASSEWGTQGLSARNSLIDFLEHSATTFTWRFNCQPEGGPGGRSCAMLLRPLDIAKPDGYGNTKIDSLLFDRCPQCTQSPRR